MNPNPFRAAADFAGQDLLPPVRLPLTIVTTGATTRASAAGRKSWGNRLGLWWTDAEEGEPGVVVTGLLPSGPAAQAGAIQVGDLVVEVEGVSVTNLGDITRYLEGHGPGPLRMGIRRGDHDERQVVLEVPPEPGEGPAAAVSAADASGFSARVPTTSLQESLKGYIAWVLTNPLQREVTHPGVSADPDFGCLGADLDFSLRSVGLSEIRNAIVQCEPRLKEVEVESAEFDVREEGETFSRPGIRVHAQLAASGEKVIVELEVAGLQRARQTNRKRASAFDAGLEQR